MGLKGSICTMVGGQDEGRKCAVKFWKFLPCMGLNI
jgi:hypothetical protein